jgi:flagellar hook protein FlgE
MMRSLWSGVSGLQAHQIAMDVEGNNIANVNTIGFKYSRANFSDMLNQTSKIATAPQGSLGGKNPMQVGLGTQVSSITKIFSQGSVQTTDKNTDVAIQGDGFYVVSPDGGQTYKFTRNGDFTFDAEGNFVDANGYIVQGWVRDDDTGIIDSTAPIQNITIPPGLTTPANDTGYITLKANLNSGDTVVNSRPIYTLDSYSGWYDADGNGIQSSTEIHDENDTGVDLFDTDKMLIERGQDLGALFNASGEAFNLQDDQGVWVSYAEARTNNMVIEASGGTETLDIIINGVSIQGSLTTTGTASIDDNQLASYMAQKINEKTSETGVEAKIIGGNSLVLVNTNKSGTEASTKNIALTVNQPIGGFGTTFDSVEVITAFQYTYSSSSIPPNLTDRAVARTFTSTEDLRNAMQVDARLNVDYLGNGNQAVAQQYSFTSTDWDAGETLSVVVNGNTYTTTTAGATLAGELADLEALIEAGEAIDVEINGNTLYATAQVPGTSFTFVDNGTAGADPAQGIATETVANVTAAQSTFLNRNDGVEVTVNESGQFQIINPTGDALNSDDGDLVITPVPPQTYNLTDITFVNGAGDYELAEDTYFVSSQSFLDVTTSADMFLPEGTVYDTVPSSGPFTVASGGATLAAGGPYDITLPTTGGATFPAGTTFDPAGASTAGDQVVTVGADTRTANDHDMFISVTSLTNDANQVSENSRFAASMGALQGALNSGTGVRTSQSLQAAAHASSIDVYDSLGTKHTVRFEFTKTGFTADGGTEWSIIVSVPEPGELRTSGFPLNTVTGSISFNSDGSLSTFTPTNLTYTANNGSTPNQNIELQFGSIGQFDGMTSFDAQSNTSGISQDGFPGGDLSGIRIDESGTLIGSFTNGRSFGLAQLSMAKFTNNEGLEADGGNAFVQTSNSGDPIIGQASTGGRGFVQASALEMSNVDLSRSLTQLIVVQRGFQANSKTITTSDQMLNTLLQIKQ